MTPAGRYNTAENTGVLLVLKEKDMPLQIEVINLTS
jgi:hypothetical protein